MTAVPAPFADRAAHRISGGLQLGAYGLHEPDPKRLFEAVVHISRVAERSGYDALLVIDHFYGMPSFGSAEDPMLEAYTLLGALAAVTEHIQLGALVTGVTYRNPAVLVKSVSTLDVIAGGRALFSLGAAWFEQEHAGLGITFPPLSERFDRLAEALHICTAMLTGERLTYAGQHYHVTDAINSPRPLAEHVPIVLGGNGERRTFPLMAQHADIASLTSDLAEVPHKVAVLRDRCRERGRDPRSLWTTWHGTVFGGTTTADAEGRRDAYLGSRGLPAWNELSAERQRRAGARWLCGDEDRLVDDLAALRRHGIDGFTCTVLAPADDDDAFSVPGAAFSAVAAA